MRRNAPYAGLSGQLGVGSVQGVVRQRAARFCWKEELPLRLQQEDPKLLCEIARQNLEAGLLVLRGRDELPRLRSADPQTRGAKLAEADAGDELDQDRKSGARLCGRPFGLLFRQA